MSDRTQMIRIGQIIVEQRMYFHLALKSLISLFENVVVLL